jgi:hypothetical protein
VYCVQSLIKCTVLSSSVLYSLYSDVLYSVALYCVKSVLKCTVLSGSVLYSLCSDVLYSVEVYSTVCTQVYCTSGSVL